MMKKLMVLAAVALMAIALYLSWDALIVSVVQWQKHLHGLLAEHLKAVSGNAAKYGSALVALSFAYGIFHAIGPGHGKAVIVTYLGTNKETLRKGVLISFAGALMQSLVAVLLVSGLARLLKFKFSDVHHYGNEMAQVSYVLVAVLGLLLMLTALRRLQLARKTEHRHAHQHDTQPHTHHGHHEYDAHDGAACGCSHAHVPEKNTSIWQTLTVVFSMGFRPCSGAIVVLIYAHLVGVYYYGVLATMMMGIGTGLSVSVLAIMTHYARNWLERFTLNGQQKNLAISLKFGNYLRLAGGLILLALGWSLYSTAAVMAGGHPLF